MAPFNRLLLLFLSSLLTFSPLASAVKLIKSNSLDTCQQNSKFTATLFNVMFTPNNNSLSVDMVGVSSIDGNITASAEILAYGFNVMSRTVDLCDLDIDKLCPMTKGPVTIDNPFHDMDDITKQIPSVAYNVPDLDLIIRVRIDLTNTGENIACVEARLENGKTVYHKGVAWAIAVVSGLALAVSAVVSGLGHSNTAAHVAAHALSLFFFFQSQAILGMTAVPLPPIVQSWTQNFQWSMGIIRVGFLQTLATWYLRATGGKPSTTIASLGSQSVQVMKRSLDTLDDYPVARQASHFAKRGAQLMLDTLGKRASGEDSAVDPTDQVVVRGIERVGFRANMESTNIFLTGFIFFIFFVFVVIMLVLAFKGFCELATRKGWIKSNKFQEFRTGWKVVLRGILYRLTLIGYPQMCILCLWELTKRDSPAEIVLAIFMLVALNVSLWWAAFKVIMLARRSTQLHRNPAYILYSDPAALNKWGFLYIQFRATAYYCVIPLLVYHLIKSLFVGLSQSAQVVQAIAFLVIETLTLIGVSVLRPWMDKKTNAFNIAIFAVNFINVILLLFFSNVFNQPGLVTGVMGVVFFILNAIFALVLLVCVIGSSAYAIFSKNPEMRYQPMSDDRGSFIKDPNAASNPHLNTELDALGAAARNANAGEMNEMHEMKSGGNAHENLLHPTSSGSSPGHHNDDSATARGHEDSSSSFSSEYAAHPHHQQYTAYGGGAGGGGGLPTSVPLFPAVGGDPAQQRYRNRSPGPQQQQHGGGGGYQPYAAYQGGQQGYTGDSWR